MKRRTMKSQSLLRIALVFVILILLNIVSVRIFDRIDLTRNRLYTLSDASRTLMRNLDDKVTIKAYFTDDLPAPYNNNRRMLLDQLNEYKAYARGNLVVEFIDPSGEKTEAEAQQAGVSPVQIQVIKEDKAQVQRAYMGIVFLYEDKKEVIPIVQHPEGLEYEISSTMKRLTSRGTLKVGFLTGHGEPEMKDLRTVQETMRKQYQFATVDVSKNTPVPPDIAVLVVMAPTDRFTESQKFQIDQYLMRGGRIAFLLNAIDANLQQGYGRQLTLGLDDLLASYGARVNTDLVRDAQCASISIVQQQYGFSMQSQVPFPYLPLVSNFSKGNAMVKDLQRVVLFFASSIDTADAASKGLSAEILLRSSKQSGRMTSAFAYDPMQHFTRTDFAESEIPLAAVIDGKFTSAFKGKAVPSDTAAGSAAPAASVQESSPETRIVILGDGDFARDQYMGGNRDNIALFANIVDYLVDDAGLITIRTRQESMKQLDPVSDGTRSIVKYANLIVPPLLVIGYGLLRWRIKRARRKTLEAMEKSS
jgi:gliding-associated putative ABC transporter substrate-binding component GldG